jgi:hypothetical protein
LVRFQSFSFDKKFDSDRILLACLSPQTMCVFTFASCWNLGYIWGSKVPFYEAFDLSSQTEAGGTEVLGRGRVPFAAFANTDFTGPLTALVKP